MPSPVSSVSLDELVQSGHSHDPDPSASPPSQAVPAFPSGSGQTTPRIGPSTPGRWYDGRYAGALGTTERREVVAALTSHGSICKPPTGPVPPPHPGVEGPDRGEPRPGRRADGPADHLAACSTRDRCVAPDRRSRATWVGQIRSSWRLIRAALAGGSRRVRLWSSGRARAPTGRARLPGWSPYRRPRPPACGTCGGWRWW